MRKVKLLPEEVIHYLTEEFGYEKSIAGIDVWLTTQSLRVRLNNRGIPITHFPLKKMLIALHSEGKIKKIKYNQGEIWAPIDEEGFNI